MKSFPPKAQPKCPRCNQPQIQIIESRKSEDGTRRRRECKACQYRDTTYEVSSSFYQKAKENEILVNKFRSLLSINLPETSLLENKCPTCLHNYKGMYCSFELPEFDTEDSFDCIHYKLNSKQKT